MENYVILLNFPIFTLPAVDEGKVVGLWNFKYD